MLKNYILAVLLLWCQHTLAQFDWVWLNEVNDQLPSDTVTSIAAYSQSGSPFLTIAGTTNGLVIIDQAGPTIDTIFNQTNSILTDSRITCLSHEVADNPLTQWIGTLQGLYSWNFGTEWNAYTTLNSPLPNDTITCVVKCNDGIWIGTKNGLAHFDEIDSWKIYNSSNSFFPSNHIQCLYPNCSDTSKIIIGTDSGLVFFEDGNSKILNTTNSGLLSDDITSVYSDYTGILVGTRGHGVCDSSLISSQWNYYNTLNGFPSDSIYFIRYLLYYLDQSFKTEWIGTISNGIAWISSVENIYALSEVEGITFNASYDASNNSCGFCEQYWIGTEKGIIYRVKFGGISENYQSPFQLNAYFDHNNLKVNYTNKSNEAGTLTVLDLMGRNLFFYQLPEQVGSGNLEIPIQHLPSAMYLVNLQTVSKREKIKVVKSF